jgi:hypothetical protein
MCDTDHGHRISAATLIAGIVFCAALVWADYRWPTLWTAGATAQDGLPNPAVELGKLIIAAVIGAFVTTVHRPAPHKHRPSRPLIHAQILFCVAGALTIIIIGNSLARAFGAFGIASVVRFRTPLKDPEDATVLFLLIGLGMSVGRGILAVAGLGALFVCALLWLLDHRAAPDPPKAAAAPAATPAEAHGLV